MEKTNNTINTQNNAMEFLDSSDPQCKYYDEDMEEIINSVDRTNPDCDLLARFLRGSQDMFATALNQRDKLAKANDILENRLAKVAENFLYEQVQDVIYETHQQAAFREKIESTYSKMSDLWHTLDDDQKELLSDIMHGLGVSTGMLLSEVYKAGIKACNTHGETLESLDNLETVNVSRVFYEALPTDRY